MVWHVFIGVHRPESLFVLTDGMDRLCGRRFLIPSSCLFMVWTGHYYVTSCESPCEAIRPWMNDGEALGFRIGHKARHAAIEVEPSLNGNGKGVHSCIPEACAPARCAGSKASM